MIFLGISNNQLVVSHYPLLWNEVWAFLREPVFKMLTWIRGSTGVGLFHVRSRLLKPGLTKDPLIVNTRLILHIFYSNTLKKEEVFYIYIYI